MQTSFEWNILHQKAVSISIKKLKLNILGAEFYIYPLSKENCMHV